MIVVYPEVGPAIGNREHVEFLQESRAKVFYALEVLKDIEFGDAAAGGGGAAGSGSIG